MKFISLTTTDEVPTREIPVSEAEQANITSVRARILWPAIGFPSVIAPSDKKSTIFPEGDATKCVCILLVSNKKNLSEEDAAQYLRYAPWTKRHFIRHIPYNNGQEGTFRKEDIKVLRPLQEGPKDRFGELIRFGCNKKGENGILASLANVVRKFYRDNGLEFLYEIRVNETASRQLSKGLYHLFWNNEIPTRTYPQTR